MCSYAPRWTTLVQFGVCCQQPHQEAPSSSVQVPMYNCGPTLVLHEDFQQTFLVWSGLCVMFYTRHFGPPNERIARKDGKYEILIQYLKKTLCLPNYRLEMVGPQSGNLNLVVIASRRCIWNDEGERIHEKVYVPLPNYITEFLLVLYYKSKHTGSC